MMFLTHAWAAAVVAWAFFVAHIAPILAATLLPTVIAGLSNRPSTADGKLAKLLKLAARACGWAVHYNEPGSVKLPLAELLVLAWKGAVAVYRVFKPAPMALLLAGAALALCLPNSGCATSQTAANASLAQKLKDDAAAVGQVCADVGAKCGPQFASFGKTLTDLAAAAKDDTNLLAEVLNAAALYTDGKLDIAAIKCAWGVVSTDIHTLMPAKQAMMERVVAQLEARQSFVAER